MHFLNAANETLAGHHRHVYTDAVFSAEIDQYRAPPIGGVAADDTGEARGPLRFGTEWELVAQGTIFAF